MLEQWGFAEEYNDVAKHTYDWQRKIDDTALFDLPSKDLDWTR